MSPFPYAYRYRLDEAAVAFALRELDYLFRTRTALNDTGAFLIEPALGHGGYLPTPAAVMEGLRERADHYGIQLIFDEVQAGSDAPESSGATSIPPPAPTFSSPRKVRRAAPTAATRSLRRPASPR